MFYLYPTLLHVQTDDNLQQPVIMLKSCFAKGRQWYVNFFMDFILFMKREDRGLLFLMLYMRKNVQ